jgi:hypothetical protein
VVPAIEVGADASSQTDAEAGMAEMAERYRDGGNLYLPAA